jgi:lysozyme
MRNFGMRLVLGAAVLAMLSIGAWLYATRWSPSRHDYPVQGIDVSDAQGVVHWPTAKAAGVDFAYIRATYGATGRDARFADHWAATRQARVKRGAYHQFSLCQLANDQADNIVAALPREPDELRPALLLAFDDSCTARPARDSVQVEVGTLVQAMEQQSGKPVILMISKAFDQHYGISSVIERDLWLSNGLFPPDYGARTWIMWRASTIRHIAGVDQPVHWSVLYPR